MNCKKAKLLSVLLLSIFATVSLYASGLKTAAPVVKMKPIMTVEYEYSKSGRITARKINGQVQNYKYDKKGQLLGVYDGKGNAIEEYVYDPAGNILKKTIQGRTTTYKYDKANQLVSSECNGKVTKYEYDAAGRLVKEGDKEYHYIGLDKIESVTENGRRLSSFTYHIDGQLAACVSIESSEEFQWDGLALIQRNSTNYVNEPAVTGGNPILADDKVLFNDMLGTTLGIKDGDKVMQNNLTAFGESLSASPMQDSFFTGKPHVGEMGYVFLFRAYRADQGKWQTSDPLGYPDGWNNLAYCNNEVIEYYDFLGGASAHVNCDLNAASYYREQLGPGYIVKEAPAKNINCTIKVTYDFDSISCPGWESDSVTGASFIIEKPDLAGNSQEYSCTASAAYSVTSLGKSKKFQEGNKWYQIASYDARITVTMTGAGNTIQYVTKRTLKYKQEVAE